MCFVAHSFADGNSEDKAITLWAKAAGYRVTVSKCDDRDAKRIGAQPIMCWFAKSKLERSKGDRMFVRLDIRVDRFNDEAAARLRLEHFFEPPPPSVKGGETAKTFPLRAGFRIGDRLVTVATNAFAFEPDMKRAATELAASMKAEDVRCSGSCNQSK